VLELVCGLVRGVSGLPASAAPFLQFQRAKKSDAD